MKNIKITFFFLVAMVFSTMIYGQGSPASYVSALNKRVNLTSAQKTSVTALYTKLISEMENMAEKEAIQIAKTNFRIELYQLLTPAQRTKLSSQVSPR